MTLGSKNEVLHRIRRAVKSCSIPPRAVRDVHLDQATVGAGRLADLSSEATLQCFLEMLRLVGGEGHVLADSEAALTMLRSLLCDDRGKAVLIPSELELERQAVPRLIEESGCIVLRQDATFLEYAAQAAVGITTAQAGIADTGTIVLYHSFDRGRLAALLPPVHVALLRRDRVFPDKQSFLAAARAEGNDLRSTPMSWVTGPSLTADIEKVLVRGAHGPRKLIVLLH